MRNINYIVYIHISPSDKRYIGITCQEPKKRWRNGNGYNHNTYFYRAIEKYGWDNFEHIIVARGLDEETAKWLEIELIREWDTTNPNKGYNLSLGGEGGNGCKCTKEKKEKISRANKGRKHTEESRKRMSENHWDNKGENHPLYGKTGELNPFYGKQHTDETKRKMSENHWDCGGENNPMFGKTHTEETKKKMSEGKEGMYSGENNPMFGKTHTEESKEKMSKNHADFNGGNHPRARAIILLNTKEIFLTIKEGAEKYNVHPKSVLKCCKGKYKSAGKHPITNEKLIWMYYEDYLKI